MRSSTTSFAASRATAPGRTQLFGPSLEPAEYSRGSSGERRTVPCAPPPPDARAAPDGAGRWSLDPMGHALSTLPHGGARRRLAPALLHRPRTRLRSARALPQSPGALGQRRRVGGLTLRRDEVVGSGPSPSFRASPGNAREPGTRASRPPVRSAPGVPRFWRIPRRRSGPPRPPAQAQRGPGAGGDGQHPIARTMWAAADRAEHDPQLRRGESVKNASRRLTARAVR